MRTDVDSVSALELEVARLRRNNRWLAALTALIGLGLLLSIVAPISTERSRRYSLLDDRGRQRGMWRVRDGASAMILQDSAGRWRAVTEIDAEGPSLQLNRPGGEPLIELGSRETVALVTLHDQQGRPRLRMSASEDGGELLFLDEDGQTIATFGEPEN